ncbi:stalk domain-containing protein [Paenibacillus prosopidis]|uniref:Alpha-tubulin suppressor-like RCC1 family protein n=1 Tax=Paenibacillus prosopidis TaxID=630520 RepID=A0A368VL13_9BACL|nr:stalk domain-containing protein [Paenibacillus prosopidis]RCW42391.1 alpha-tubulin suppressor-like RCC1 family protein [Paenibacillus prosopidis]
MYKSNRILKTVFLTLMIMTSAASDMSVSAAGTLKPDNANNKLLTDVVRIDAGAQSAFAIKADGSTWAWGGNYGSLGNGSERPSYTPVQMHIDHVKQISGGYRHSLIIKDDGTVWAVGGNEHGQLGNGKQSQDLVKEPIQVQDLADMIAVSAGDDHSLALRKDGTVWAWGGNENGQLGSDPGRNSLKPVRVNGLPSVVAVSAGQYQSAALGNGGEVWIWGLDKVDDNGRNIVRKPMRLKGTGEYGAISIGRQYGTALSGNGTVWMWKNEAWPTPALDTLEPFQITGLNDIISISGSAGVKADGTVWQWTIDADSGKANVIQVQGIRDAVAITEGNRNYYALLKDGTVLSWGTNEFGQAGLGVTDFRIETPQPVRKSIDIYLDGKEIAMATPPLLIQGATYVPLRGVFENMGASLSWDTKIRSAIAVKGSVTIVLNTVTGQTTVNGQTVASDRRPVLVNDSIFVPLRLVSETLGADVKWDDAAYTVRITQ